MKHLAIICVTFSAVLCQNASQAQSAGQTSGQFSKSATIELNGNIERVFPLFGAFEERKWADGWNPEVIYPKNEEMREGTVFHTKSHIPSETGGMLWTVTKYDTVSHQVQYVIYATNRVVILNINCSAVKGNKTTAAITYMLTGLNDEGTAISEHLLNRMYQHNLIDWQEAINKYLASAR